MFNVKSISISEINPGISLEVFKQPINGIEKDWVKEVEMSSIMAPKFVNASAELNP